VKISARSVLMAGVATLTITATAAAPSVQPLPSPRPEIQLAANAQQLLPQQPPLLTVLLNSPLALLGPAAPLGTLPPAPAPLAIPIAPNLANTIDNIYVAVEPWVRYGFEVATSIVRWVPYVGWFAGQIMVFYNFGESIVASGVFNFTDWLRGNGGIAENLVDFGVDVGLAFVWLGLDELAQFVPLPPIPLPPRPPLQGPGAFLAANTLLGPTAPEVGVTNAASDLVNAVYTPVSSTITYGVGVLQTALAPIPLVNIVGDQASILWNSLADPIADSVVYQLIDPVLNQPLNINSYLNGAYAVGATTVNSLINTGIQEVNYFLGIPFSAQASTQARGMDRTAEVSTVPSTVKDTLTGVRNVNSGTTSGKTTAPGPLTEVRETVRDARNVIREATGRSAIETAKAGDDTKTVGNEVVRTRHDVRGAITKAVDDVTGALGTGKPSKSADGATKASTNVVKSLGDTAKKVVKQVRQAVKDARDTVGNRPSADADK
jgi:hypothetical protein